MDAAAHPIALITGASGGIGRACAEALAAAPERWDLALHFRTGAAAANELAERLRAKYGVRCAAIQAELGEIGKSEAHAKRLLEQCLDSLGAPTAIVHAAGPVIEKPLAFTKLEDWDALFEIHVHAAAALLKEGARYLRKSDRGRVVLIGSLAGKIGLGNGAAYAAAKGALEGLCRCFALEAARWKTTVNVIAPGFVDTHLTAEHDEARRASNIAAIPLGRYGSADEIGSLAGYLCGPYAGYITGQTIVMDGGASLDFLRKEPRT